MDALVAEKGYRLFERIPWVNPRTEKVEPRVLGERPDCRFLVARDEWDHTFAPLLMSDMHRLEYGGWPVEADDALGSGAIMFVCREEGA